MADLTLQRMLKLLGATTSTVLATAWNYYHDAPKCDDKGRPKWTGFLLMTRGVNGGDFLYRLGALGDLENSKQIVTRKIESLQGTDRLASIQLRKPPKVWGGADWSKIAQAYDGLTGGAEIDDHLTLCTAQLFSGRIAEKDYELRTGLEFPGIREAIAHAERIGFNAGSYHARRGSIHQFVREAAEKMGMRP